jgi:cytoskeletal protein CcmA (bactofilin family)
MVITLHTDGYASETSLEIHDLSNNSTIYTIGYGSQAPNTTQSYTFCAPNGTCLKADLYDIGGNGGSNFDIVFQGNTYTSAPGGLFGHLSTALLGGTICTDISPVLDSGAYFIKSAGKLTIGNGNIFRGSILGNPVNGEVCLGIRNEVSGWVSGDKIALGESNQINGYNNIQLFGKDYGSNCQSGSGLPAHDMHITNGPWGNVADGCDPNAEIIPSDEDITLIGEGPEMDIHPGHFGDVIVKDGAKLVYFPPLDPNIEGPFYYTMESLTIDGGIFKSAGGGVLCDIFINTKTLIIGNGAEVSANINCEQIIVGDGNVFKGEFQATEPGNEFVIGDNNVFDDPICPACLNHKKEKQGNGSIEQIPQMKIWPNPSDSGEINIAAPAGKLEVFNLNGLSVFDAELDGPDTGNVQVKVISTKDLRPGMYISRVITTDGRILNGKFLLLGS